MHQAELPPSSESARWHPDTAARPLSRRRALALAAACGVSGMLAWAVWVWVFASEPAQDWMVFYTAARAYFDGNLPLLFDGERLTAELNRAFATWLALPLNLHPWVYPPTFLLLFLPFGALPPAASLPVFLLAGFAASAIAAGLYVGHGQARKILLFSLVLCPAVSFNVMTGQNAFFTAALLLGGFGLLGRAPLLAGALFGVLSVKPQLWLLMPVALLAARQWRALAGMTVTALALALLSLAMFGPEIWRSWIALATGADEAYRAWLVNGRLNGISVFACVSLLGAPQPIPSVVQGMALAIAIAAVYLAFRRPATGALQLSVLLAAAILAAPHVSTSDAVLLGLAAALYVVAPRPEPLHLAPLLLAAMVWISPLLDPPRVFRPGSLMPLLVLMLIAVALAEIRTQPVHSAPAPLPRPARPPAA